MRVLVVSNMAPAADHPERGGFVRDQVAALRRRDDVEVVLAEFRPGGYRGAVRSLRRRHGSRPWDVVHAHFGLTAGPALAVPAHRRGVTLHGRDLRHPRSRRATTALLPTQDLVALASADLRSWLPRPWRGRGTQRVRVLPVGLDLARFAPRPRDEARRRLGVPPQEPFLLFPYAPDRRVKRVDRARELGDAAGVRVRTLGGVPPDRMTDWLNAASAVVVPSEHEGFGLAAVEALACDVPVLATPTGAHAETVGRVRGCLCAPWDLDAWLTALGPLLDDGDARVAGRPVAERHGTDRYAADLVEAWRSVR